VQHSLLTTNCASPSILIAIPEGGYLVYQGLPIVYQSSEEISELLVNYLKRTKTVPPVAYNNWKIESPEALAAIEKAPTKRLSATRTDKL
jgi:hypothetical protein